MSVDGGGEGCEQHLVETSDGGVGVAGQRHHAMTFEAMHELMRHHAIGAQQVGAVEATRHGIVLLALASRTMGTCRDERKERIGLDRRDIHMHIIDGRADRDYELR